MQLVGLLLGYVTMYVVGALVLLRLLTGEWPDRFVPGSRVDWFEADLEREGSWLQRVRNAIAADVEIRDGLDPRRVDLTPYERAEFGIARD